MKTLKNLLKPKNFLIGATVFLSSCGADYRFNLDGLEPWQRNLFLEAGDDAGMVIEIDSSSENKAYLGELSGNTIGHASTKLNISLKELSPKEMLRPDEIDLKKYTIIFDQGRHWVDCSKVGEYGTDFKRVAEHELRHIGGEGHSDKPENIMYPIVPQRC